MMTFLYVIWAITATIAVIVAVMILRRRSSARPFKIDKDRLILPHNITAEELGIIEGGLPGLKSINVICHYIEDPAGKLDAAVVRNLKAGIPYTFLISPSRAEDEVFGYYQIFQKYAELASADTPTEQLVSIRRLDSEWTEFPCIFYSIIAGTRRFVIAYRGTQMNEGIADRYELMDGHETAGVLTAALRNATSIEEALPDLTKQPTTHERTKHTSNRQ